jgi:two-component system nitrogen regulation response regulator GlnG
VMAAGREVLLSDIPPEMQGEDVQNGPSIDGDWQQLLRRWAQSQLQLGHSDILSQATPEFERTMIEVALEQTAGRKKEAAQLLGWGRNTLTRKLQEYQLEP